MDAYSKTKTCASLAQFISVVTDMFKIALPPKAKKHDHRLRLKDKTLNSIEKLFDTSAPLDNNVIVEDARVIAKVVSLMLTSLP